MVNPVYNEKNIKKLTDEYNKLMKQKELVNSYCRQNDISEDEYQKFVKDNSLAPKNFPRVRKMFKKYIVDTKVLDKRIEEIKNEYKNLTDSIYKNDG